MGQRLRHMRKRLHMTIEDLSRKSRLSHNVIARLERDETRKLHPWVLGRILPFLASRFKETFPESAGDPYNFLIPPTSFGNWLKNFRMRRGLTLSELARKLNVRPYTVIRYEADESKPASSILDRFRRAFGLDREIARYFPANHER